MFKELKKELSPIKVRTFKVEPFDITFSELFVLHLSRINMNVWSALWLRLDLPFGMTVRGLYDVEIIVDADTKSQRYKGTPKYKLIPVPQE